MTPAEHYAEAEQLLADLRPYRSDEWDGYSEYCAYRANEIAEAQVHATLATVAQATYLAQARVS